jgi:uncharacterized membrane protein
MTPLASALPEHTNDGYVAAAYIVFFAIVLIYVAIMAIRLGRVERKVRELSTRERERAESAPKEHTATGTTQREGRAGETV